MGMVIFFNILAILVLIVSILFFTATRKWSVREIQRIENKKKEIEEILGSADQMIDELNRFSDYMITCIEDKVREIKSMMVKIDVKVDSSRTMMAQQAIVEQKGSNPRCDEENNEAERNISKTIVPFSNKGIAFNANKIYSYSNYSKASLTENRAVDKIINSNMKSKQIISLAEKGFSETEIARKLNVGRGEIQLVLGMKNSTAS